MYLRVLAERFKGWSRYPHRMWLNGLLFQHSPPYGPQISSIGVAVLGSHWPKKSLTVNMTSSYELFSWWTFQTTSVSIYLSISLSLSLSLLPNAPLWSTLLFHFLTLSLLKIFFCPLPHTLEVWDSVRRCVAVSLFQLLFSNFSFRFFFFFCFFFCSSPSSFWNQHFYNSFLIAFHILIYHQQPRSLHHTKAHLTMKPSHHRTHQSLYPTRKNWPLKQKCAQSNKASARLTGHQALKSCETSHYFQFSVNFSCCLSLREPTHKKKDTQVCWER